MIKDVVTTLEKNEINFGKVIQVKLAKKKYSLIKYSMD